MWSKLSYVDDEKPRQRHVACCVDDELLGDGSNTKTVSRTLFSEDCDVIYNLYHYIKDPESYNTHTVTGSAGEENAGVCDF